MRRGWRILTAIWVVIIASLAGVLVALGLLGPMAQPRRIAAEPANASPVPADTQQELPRAADTRRRIGILLVGIGLAEADSRRAIATLPPEISFAVSPYAVAPGELLTAMRQTHHEYLLSLPFEPGGFPLNDAGPHALLTGASTAVNDTSLDWAMDRVKGEVGVTGALDGLRGERFAAAPTLLAPVLADIDHRGLFYIDPRPGAARSAEVAGRSIDLVLDDSPDQADIDRSLRLLEQAARENGAAIGLAGPPRPVLVDRLAAWSVTLEDRGMKLVPISRLVRPKMTAEARP